MKSSLSSNLEVFDLKAKDDPPEFAAGKCCGRLGNPSFGDIGLVNFELLSPDIKESRCENDFKNANSRASISPTGEDAAPKEGLTRSFVGEVEMRLLSPKAPSPQRSQLDHPLSNSPCSDAHDIAVSLSTDYVMNRGRYFTAVPVTFSCTGIKIHGSDAYGSLGSLDIEWNIDDVVSVNCRWFERVEEAIIRVRLLKRDVEEADKVTGVEELKLAVADPNWPGKQQEILALNVKYAAVWSISLEPDTCMDGTGSAVQTHYFPIFDHQFEEVVYPKGDSDAVAISKRDVDLLQPETFINDTIIDFYVKYLKNNMPHEKKQSVHFFNSFFFRKLADLDRDPSIAANGRAAFLRVRKWTRKIDIFGKDYIFIPVNFNLHWSLIVICHPGEVAGFQDEQLEKSLKVPCILHMDSIKGTHSGLKNLIQRILAFEKAWNNILNLFQEFFHEQKYIQSHRIIGSHSSKLKNHLASLSPNYNLNEGYLCEEYRERKGVTPEDISLKFLNLRFVPLELPQQENSFDCGLFLLHYLELFLTEAPPSFNPFKITKYSNFLNVKWFLPLEASLKRTLIEKLIFQILEDRSLQVSPAPGSDGKLFSKAQNNSGNDTCLDFLADGASPTMDCQANLSNPCIGEGIEITGPTASSVRNSLCVDESELVLKDYLETGATSATLPAQSSYQRPSNFHLNGALSIIEEDTRDCEHFMQCSGNAEFSLVAEMAPQTSAILNPPGSFGGIASYSPEISAEAGCNEYYPSRECSNYHSSSDDILIVGDHPVQENMVLDQKLVINERKSTLALYGHCITNDHSYNSCGTVEISAPDSSHQSDDMHDTGLNFPPSCEGQEYLKAKKRSHEESDMIESSDVACENGDDKVLESPEEQAAKKLRLASP